MGDNNSTSEWAKESRNESAKGGDKANDRTNGQRAENLAARFLERRGLSVLARNVRCRGGELDLVCRDGDTLVFVEVRLRRSDAYGGAAASVTAAKQRRVILAARYYLAAHASAESPCRFDCVLLNGKRIDWVRDAFAAN